MSNDRHQASSYPLRMPPELKQRAQEAADQSGRSLHGELLLRIQVSLDESTGSGTSDLVPAVVRMERDIAKLEVDKAAETLYLRMVVTTLRTLLAHQPENSQPAGLQEGTTVMEWLSLCDTVLDHKTIHRSDVDSAIDRLKSAEAALRAYNPVVADPIGERLERLSGMNAQK
ncbi:Arc family DNA-binding protein [Comamonadaceae bacterium PP-2]